jgi:hypothetical protein
LDGAFFRSTWSKDSHKGRGGVVERNATQYDLYLRRGDSSIATIEERLKAHPYSRNSSSGNVITRIWMTFSSKLPEEHRRCVVDLLLNLGGYFSWFGMGIIRHDDNAAASGASAAAAASGASVAVPPGLPLHTSSRTAYWPNAISAELDAVTASAAVATLPDFAQSPSLGANADDDRSFPDSLLFTADVVDQMGKWVDLASQPVAQTSVPQGATSANADDLSPPPSEPVTAIDAELVTGIDAVPASAAVAMPLEFVAPSPSLHSLAPQYDSLPLSERITDIGAPDDANRNATEDGIDDMEEGERRDRLRYLELARAVTRSIPAVGQWILSGS